MLLKKLPKKLNLEIFDESLIKARPLFGVDEVGRGCLAGPVVAAAVCLQNNTNLEELTDSKLLSEKRRDELGPLIQSEHAWAIGFATVEEIDQINILWASMLAMQRAVLNLEEKLGKKAAHILVDGNRKIPKLEREQTALVKGDLRAKSISAASIVAKVYRDEWMRKISEEHPQYGFAKHKGYPSPVHKQAIQDYGITSWHRKTFKGVKEFTTSKGL